MIVQEEPGNTTTARDTSAIAGHSSVVQSNYSRPPMNKVITFNAIDNSVLKEGDMPRMSSASKKVSVWAMWSRIVIFLIWAFWNELARIWINCILYNHSFHYHCRSTTQRTRYWTLTSKSRQTWTRLQSSSKVATPRTWTRWWMTTSQTNTWGRTAPCKWLRILTANWRCLMMPWTHATLNTKT